MVVTMFQFDEKAFVPSDYESSPSSRAAAVVVGTSAAAASSLLAQQQQQQEHEESALKDEVDASPDYGYNDDDDTTPAYCAPPPGFRFPRRNGFYHSGLLQSAVLASIYDSSHRVSHHEDTTLFTVGIDEIRMDDATTKTSPSSASPAGRGGVKIELAATKIDFATRPSPVLVMPSPRNCCLSPSPSRSSCSPVKKARKVSVVGHTVELDSEFRFSGTYGYCDNGDDNDVVMLEPDAWQIAADAAAATAASKTEFGVNRRCRRRVTLR